MNPHYLKLTIRNAFKNGTLSFAKIFGLSISFAVILFAAGFVYYETSFDKCIPDHDRIYRCIMDGKLNGQDASFAVTSPNEAGAIASEIPEITEALRIFNSGETNIKYAEENFNWGQLIYADPNFFSFFSIPIKTNLNNPLASENNLVIAKSLAEKHFGSVESALDKVVKMGNEDCLITGVFDDVPNNFHLQPQLVRSLQKLHPEKVGWGSQSYYTYFKTKKSGIDADDLNFKISKTVYSHSDSEGRINGAKAKSWADLKYAPDVYIFYKAEPLTEIHFSNHKFDPAVTADKTYVYGAIVLAILILLISSFNFINLSIANISKRLKTVGIQKITGAKNQHILKQFLFEASIFLFVSFILAVLIYEFAENSLEHFLNFNIALSDLGLLKVITIVFIALLLFNLVANIFPIFIISNKKILNLIKQEKNNKRRFSVNDCFLFLQFVLSGLIILSSIIVHKQINYIVSKNPGYDAHNVMMLTMWEMHPETRRSFIEELKNYDIVESVATSDAYFGRDLSTNAAFFELQEDKNYFHTSILPVDDGFLNTFNFKMREGRFFEKEKQTDFQAAILNESALKLYSGNGSMIDKNVIINDKIYRVIGIVKDFNFRSLHHPIQPLLMTRIENFGNVYIKIKNNKIPEVIHIVQKQWKKYNITVPLNYEFHDDIVAMHYMKDQQAKKLLLILSIISIAIACVGLYAISFFTIIKRTKEIGIRKVNGAQSIEILNLLSQDFLKWVTLAFIIACPLAWYAMTEWLQNFAYKTELNWWIFTSAGALTMTVAILTVSWQSWRVARRNPVESLRYE